MGCGLAFGLTGAAGTVWLSARSSATPAVTGDLLCLAFALWWFGWMMAPAWAGSGSLRPAEFAVLPLSRWRLATGLTGASLVGVGAVVTVVAFTALARYGVSLGVGPALVAVVALALQLLLVVVVAAARVTAGVFGSLARSRTGAAMVGITTAAMMVITQWGGWWSSPSTAQAFSTPASVVGSPGCCDGSRRAGASSPCRPPIATIGRLLSPPSPGSPS